MLPVARRLALGNRQKSDLRLIDMMYDVFYIKKYLNLKVVAFFYLKAYFGTNICQIAASLISLDMSLAIGLNYCTYIQPVPQPFVF